MPRTATPYDAALRDRLARPGNALTRLDVLPRRVLVAAAAAGMLAAIVLPWPAGGAWLPAAYAGLFGALLINVVLGLATRTIAELPDRVLDERSRGRRERAAFVALRVTGWIVTAAALLVAVLAGRPGLHVTQEQVIPSAVGIALVVNALSTWVLAWTEPSPLTDDEVAPVGAAAGPLPWGRLAGFGVYFGALMAALRLLGWGDVEPATPVEALVVGLVSGVLFAGALGLWTRWMRRRI